MVCQENNTHVTWHNVAVHQCKTHVTWTLLQCVANAVCCSGLPGTSPMPELTPERSERSDEPVTNITTKHCITYTRFQYQNNIKRKICRAIAFWNLLLWFWFISWCICTQTEKHTCASCVHLERERERARERARGERGERERERENKRASERASERDT